MVSWKEHRTNDDMLSMVQEERSMVKDPHETDRKIG